MQETRRTSDLGEQHVLEGLGGHGVLDTVVLLEGLKQMDVVRNRIVMTIIYNIT